MSIKKITLVLAAVSLLAVSCRKSNNQQVQNVPPPKPNYTITDQKSGMRTFSSDRYHFSFDYSPEFTLQQSAPYDYSDKDKKLVTSTQINLGKGQDLKYYITVNPQTTGCGINAKQISTKSVTIDGQKVTKNSFSQAAANTTCVEYTGMSGKEYSVYFMAIVPEGDKEGLAGFDALVSSFKLAK